MRRQHLVGRAARHPVPEATIWRGRSLRNRIPTPALLTDMETAIDRALATDRTADITTTGRHSGLPGTVEIWFHNVDGSFSITGTPGTRDWYANLIADPVFTVSLKESVRADLDARAVAITDPEQRLRALETITGRLGAVERLEDWLAAAPLVRVDLTQQISPSQTRPAASTG